MLKRSRSTKQVIAAAQAVALLALGSAAQATSVGTPGGGKREPIDFLAGSPFSNSTWTPAHNAHIPGIANGLGLAKHGFSLILDSTSADISLGHGLIHGHNSVDILLGTTETSFSANDKVTAAEFIAIMQKLADRGRGTQTLLLDSNGIATGGTFSMNGLVSPRITELEIPQNVVALDNIRLNPLMGLMGPLINNGTIYAYSTSNRIHTGLIYSSDRAGNGGTIQNDDTGLISTSVPLSALPGGTRPLSSINLVLAADNDIINHGSILGSGSLKFATAYGTIQNTPTNPTGSPTPIIQAFGNVELLPGADPTVSPLTATVTNLGTINSTSGNIHIASPVKNADIVLNGIASNGIGGFNVGTMEAFFGAVNVRSAAYNGSGQTLINGGLYQGDSGGFNIFSGSGAITADANNHNTEVPTSAFQSPQFTFTTTGAVDIADSTSSGVTIGNSTGGSINVAVGGSTTLTAMSATNGNLYVSTDSGVLRTIPYAQISATGNLTLQNLDTPSPGNSPDGQLVIGTGSSIQAGGNVALAVDSLAPSGSTAISNGDVSNLSVSGTVLTSAASPTNCISASLPVNTAAAAGASSILFDIENTNSLGSGAIQLQGLVNISSGTPVGYTEGALRADEMIVDSGLDAE